MGDCAEDSVSAGGKTARDNHYVPQGLLERWAYSHRVHAYRTLVSHADVPYWSLVSVRGAAYRRDLYTAVQDNQEIDDVERWFAAEFERPGLDASARLIDGRRPSRDDWYAMIRFVALQQLRTPQAFFEAMERWQKTIPKILDSTTRDALSQVARARRRGEPIVDPSTASNAFAGLIDARVLPLDGSQSAHSVVRTEVVIGRRFWLAQIRHVLSGVAAKLLEHQWSVWEPAENEEWPITDDPSIRLNFYAPERFDFDGGWGKRGSELMMPVSPRHLLYTQVGKRSRRRLQASLEQTRTVQRILATRAYRWIFGSEPYPWVSELRPRVVDSARYAAESALWDRWHEEQIASEASGADDLS